MANTRSHAGPIAQAGAPLLRLALARNWWKFLLRGVAALLFGAAAFAWPGGTILALTMLWGAYALVDGVLALWAAIAGGANAPRWWLAVIGATGIGAGVLTFLWPGATAFALLMVIGAWSVLTGVMQIVGAVRLRREIEGEWMLALSGILSIAFGLLMLSQPAAGAVAMAWMLGLVAMALGAVFVALAFRLKKHAA